MGVLEYLLTRLPLEVKNVQKLHESIGLFQMYNLENTLKLCYVDANTNTRYVRLAHNLVKYRGCVDQDLDPWILLYPIKVGAQRASLISGIAACFDTYWSLYVHDQMTQEVHKSNEENRRLTRRIQKLETDLQQTAYANYYNQHDIF